MREPLEKVPAGKVSLRETVRVLRDTAADASVIGAVVMVSWCDYLLCVHSVRQGWFSIVPVMMPVTVRCHVFPQSGWEWGQNEKSSGEIEADRQDRFDQADVRARSW